MSPTSIQSIDETRRVASDRLDPNRRASLGQFMTPSPIANFMASLFHRWPNDIRLLDPGAGIGSLTDSFVTRFLETAPRHARLNITTFEVEPVLVPYLRERLTSIDARIQRTGRDATSAIIENDFIVEGTFAGSFAKRPYTHTILNPPYKKIGMASEHRTLLKNVGIEVVNLYAGFLALSVALTKDDGEIVAIVPRSFCNGVYFRLFRAWLLDRVAFTHIHVFESRKKAFEDDGVLQENIIICLVRGGLQGNVTISTSRDSNLEDYVERVVPFSEIVKPLDSEQFIHIPTAQMNRSTALFSHALKELGIEVATGPVVDFRVKDHWRKEPGKDTAPLIYAHHFRGGTLQWPRKHKKPNALSIVPETTKWLMPQGWYVITKRFSAKEERRRIVAYVVDPNQLPHNFYGFENHLNVIHENKRGLPEDLARGLALFLNSTIVDLYFRTFSGHTQVNATDLRNMRFPSREMLLEFGRWAKKHPELTQEKIDAFIESYDGKS